MTPDDLDGRATPDELEEEANARAVLQRAQRLGSWHRGPLLGFDLETTSPDPQEARIVTAALAMVHGSGDTPPGSMLFLADPGVEIPEEATAVHGITTEIARRDGRPREEIIGAVMIALAGAADQGVPVAVFNARYDLTVMAREAERVGINPGCLHALHVVDPSVLDKWLDRFRKSYPHGMTPEQAAEKGVPSSRTLEGMCRVYGARLDGAHDAGFDAMAAARLAWAIAERGDVRRRVRNRGDAIELNRMRSTWQRVRHDLAALHDFQRDEALRERERFADYKLSIGEADVAAQIRAEVGWPVLDPVAVTS